MHADAVLYREMDLAADVDGSGAPGPATWRRKSVARSALAHHRRSSPLIPERRMALPLCIGQ
jgi:hypothetical protein